MSRTKRIYNRRAISYWTGIFPELNVDFHPYRQNEYHKKCPCCERYRFREEKSRRPNNKLEIRKMKKKWRKLYESDSL